MIRLTWTLASVLVLTVILTLRAAYGGETTSTFVAYGRPAGATANRMLPVTGAPQPVPLALTETERATLFRLNDRVYENEVTASIWHALEAGFEADLAWVMREGETVGTPPSTLPPATTSTTVRTTSTSSSTTITSSTTTSTLPRGSVTPAAHAQGRHRSIRIPYGEQCMWWDGETATQAQAAELHNQWARIFPEGLAFAETVPGCPMGKALGDLEAIGTRLAGDYVLGKGWPTWKVKRDCNGYGFDNDLAVRLHACALANPTACAESPYLTDYLAQVIDVRVEGGRCIPGNPAIVVLPPANAWDTYRNAEGLLDFRTPLPAISDAARTRNHAAHLAHAQVSDFQCGRGPEPMPKIVDTLHLTLEATARTETEKHLLQMASFSGQIDTDCAHGDCWTHDEVCAWAAIKDRAHEIWMVNVDAMGGPAPTASGYKVSGFTSHDSRWTDAGVGEVIHQIAHLCTAWKGPYRVRFPCDQDDINNCPKLSCADWLRWFTEGPSAFPKVTRKHAPIPWLEPGWRKPAAPIAAPRM